MGIAFAIDAAGRHMSPEAAAEMARLTARVAELEAERHVTNEALDDAVRELRRREQRDAAVAKFVADRAGYITAIRNCHPDNGRDLPPLEGQQ
ncbi:hypothetical protein [Streptomyces antibioticus]|uniref:hypothetical protein n=1 Tax=Streptomyces antibioticus TaxID=1890 RepID=UPI0033F26055